MYDRCDCDASEPKIPFLPVDTTTHNRRFQKSPLWPEFLEMIVFCDKTGPRTGGVAAPPALLLPAVLGATYS